VVTPLSPERSEGIIGCCELRDGSYAAYNTQSQACCGRTVQDLDVTVSCRNKT